MPTAKKTKKTFTVEIERTTRAGVSIEVQAFDADEARDLACEKADDDEDLEWEELDYETSVNEVTESV